MSRAIPFISLPVEDVSKNLPPYEKEDQIVDTTLPPLPRKKDHFIQRSQGSIDFSLLIPPFPQELQHPPIEGGLPIK